MPLQIYVLYWYSYAVTKHYARLRRPLPPHETNGTSDAQRRIAAAAGMRTGEVPRAMTLLRAVGLHMHSGVLVLTFYFNTLAFGASSSPRRGGGGGGETTEKI